MYHDSKRPLQTQTAAEKDLIKNSDHHTIRDHSLYCKISKDNAFKKIFNSDLDVIEHDLHPADECTIALIDAKRVFILNVLNGGIYIPVAQDKPCKILIMLAGKKSYKKEST